MIHETTIEPEFNGIGYAAFKAQFQITYNPAYYDDEADECFAEFLPLQCGDVTLTRDMLVGMTCAAFVRSIEEYVAVEWYENGGPSDLSATRAEERELELA